MTLVAIYSIGVFLAFGFVYHEVERDDYPAFIFGSILWPFLFLFVVGYAMAEWICPKKGKK